MTPLAILRGPGRPVHRPRSGPAARGGWLARALLVACVALLRAVGLGAQGPGEYDLKAVFVFNFAQFVEWPESAFVSPTGPFVIGILGPDPFGSTLDRIVAGETVNGRAIEVRRYRTVAEVIEAPCHILFLGRTDGARAGAIHDALGDRAILTVGDSSHFAAAGGVVQFLVVNNRVRVRINMEAARHRHLSISSKLLRVAEVVDDPASRG